ncbi:hypothetical protein ACOMHN_050085 [Nucella lapillus]
MTSAVGLAKDILSDTLRSYPQQNIRSDNLPEVLEMNCEGKQVVRVIRKLEHSKKRLRTLVEKLQTVCTDTDPSLLEGVTSPVMGPAVDFANLRSLSLEQLLLEALRSEDESRSLQGQANFMLQRLGTRAPELLQAFLAILDSSDTDSCTSCQSN